METAVIVACIAAAVTATGWFIARYHETSARKAELQLKYLERQINEFYGPLVSLIKAILKIAEIKEQLMEREDCRLSSLQKDKLEGFLGRNYFYPLHTEAKEILCKKLHLINGSEMPKSFHNYLRHATQENIQRSIWEELHINTLYLQGEPFPKEFYYDLKQNLDQLLHEYEKQLGKLEDRTVSRPLILLLILFLLLIMLIRGCITFNFASGF